jgi:predicted phage terminase large subunit-like protein
MPAPAIQEVHIGPNPGPQTAAFASTADITVYGGQAGGGKSYLTLLRFAVHADQTPGYSAIIFRREMPMVKQAGGLWEESMGLFPVFGATANSGDHFWRFKKRSLIQFRGLQHANDVLNYQGAQLHEFCFEEATHFEESQFWYLYSRLRKRIGGTDFRARCMLTCNPDPDSWVRRLIDWWIGDNGLAIPDRAGRKRYFLRDGDELIWGDSAEEVAAKAPHLSGTPQTLRFIPATLADNPKGDPDYRSKLEALPKIERDRLLGGNWNIKAVAGTYFRRAYFEVIDRWPGRVVRRVRAWDLAATEPHSGNADPDWTVGVRLAELDDGRWLVEHVERCRLSPGKRDRTIQTIASQDGRDCTIAFWQDPAQAGKSQAHDIVSKLPGYHVVFLPATKAKEIYAGPVSSWAEHKGVLLLRGDWNEPFLKALESFPSKTAHDDDVDAFNRAAQELFPSQDEYDDSYDNDLPGFRM